MNNPLSTLLSIVHHSLQQHPILFEHLKFQGFDTSLQAIKNVYSIMEPLLKMSHSQFMQDIFVMSQLGFPSGGFFVEVGATDGVHFSNTLLMETNYSWRGILAEPAKIWHQKLFGSRRCVIDHHAVWSLSGQKLEFLESQVPTLSSLAASLPEDMHSSARIQGSRYFVDSISLTDLLHNHNAPSDIEYLSLDTEGSEFEILSAHRFDQYSFKIITVEHNYTNARHQLLTLLEDQGYMRVFTDISGCDDWYVRKY